MHSAFEVEFVLLVYVYSVVFAVYVVNSDFFMLFSEYSVIQKWLGQS